MAIKKEIQTQWSTWHKNSKQDAREAVSLAQHSRESSECMEEKTEPMLESKKMRNLRSDGDGKATEELKRGAFWTRVVARSKLVNQQEKKVLQSLEDGINWMTMPIVSHAIFERHQEIFYLVRRRGNAWSVAVRLTSRLL